MPADISPTVNDEATVPIRIGVRRAPDASEDITVATMEARVVRTELERRLGPITLDLRTDGDAVGPWLPQRHAAWSADVDATIDLGGLDDAAHHLVALFGRTVEPAAAEVRERMLEHLAILPIGDEPLTDDLIERLLPSPARPTDVWLVVRAATTLATSELAHQSLRLDGDVAVGIDRWFDEAVASVPTNTRAGTVARLRAEVAELRSLLAEANDDKVRAERAALDRLADVQAERDLLRERLDRTELDRATADEGIG